MTMVITHLLTHFLSRNIKSRTILGLMLCHSNKMFIRCHLDRRFLLNNGESLIMITSEWQCSSHFLYQAFCLETSFLIIFHLKTVSSDDDVWELAWLKFYDSNECAAPKVEGTAIASKIYTSEEYSTERAFDGSKETKWGGPQDTDGNIWLGMRFPAAKQVRWIFFSDRGDIAKKVSVKASNGRMFVWLIIFRRKS